MVKEQKNMDNSDNRLTEFKKMNTQMLRNTHVGSLGLGMGFGRDIVKNYDREEVLDIINGSDIGRQVALSQHFYNKDGFYKRLVSHYATLFKFAGILAPNEDKEVSDSTLERQYTKALKYVDRTNVVSMFQRITLKVLTEGAYYGLLPQKGQSRHLSDLPFHYCRTRFRDEFGVELVELNLAYFNTLTDSEYRELILNLYPKHIRETYNSLAKGNSNFREFWVVLDPSEAVVFRLANSCRPQLLHIIPTSMDYEDAVTRQAEREIEEIKKVIVQKIPHLADGTLLFEPIEAAEMHKGMVNMMTKNNPNTSIMTTYGDVESLTTKVNADPASTNNLQKMKENIYNTAGASSQAFSATGNIAMENSLKNDLAYLMPLIVEYSNWLTRAINNHAGSSKISFHYQFLPVTWYNESEYITTAVNMASYGYSLLIPAVAMGITQKDLVSLKRLENNLLKLDKELLPLQSSHTMSSDDRKDDVGRPQLEGDEKSDKTIANESAEEKMS